MSPTAPNPHHTCARRPSPTPPQRTHFDGAARVAVNTALRVAGRGKYAARSGGGGVTRRLEKKKRAAGEGEAHDVEL